MKHTLIVFFTLMTSLASAAHASVDLSLDFEHATGSIARSAHLAAPLEQWDGSSAFPEIVKQAPLGACQSFAMTAFMEYAFFRRTGQVVNFSEKATSYGLLRYMIDEFYDATTATYPDNSLLGGRPNLGSGVAAYMIDATLNHGLWPDALYGFGALDASIGAVNLDVPTYMATFEQEGAPLKRDEYLAKLDEAFLSAPPNRFVFKVPYLDFATGKSATWEARGPKDLLSLINVGKESFSVYHNKDIAPFYHPEWKVHESELNGALSELTKKKSIREATLNASDLRQKIVESLERRMVVMVAASVWAGSWKDGDRVYQGGGGHAMVIVGYQKIDGRLFFKLRNSWGPGVGIGGYNIVEDTVLLPNLLEVTVLEI